jgi:ABC-2 type transport system permease protein
MRCFVLLAAAREAGGLAAGYDPEQIATYTWLSQGLIGTVMLWGWTDLGDRIRTGDVVSDLLRPIHPVTSYLAVDLGRAAYATLSRFAVPLALGAALFDLYMPRRPVSYPLFAVSVGLAVVVCFGCRYLVNAAAFWLLDMRGIGLVWTFSSGVFTGLVVPLPFFPGWLAAGLWATPFPSIMQAPLDVIVERRSMPVTLALVAGQAAWAVALLLLCRYVQQRAERRMVIQGG